MAQMIPVTNRGREYPFVMFKPYPERMDGGKDCVRYYVAHGSDPRNRCYIKSSSREQIAHCKEQERKHREELIREK
jgi:hypothetical protein